MKKKIWWVYICFLVCVFVPLKVQAAESVTGGESISKATEINWDTEYTTTNEDGWFKLKIPENLYCIGAGYDKLTEIYGCAGDKQTSNIYKSWWSPTDGYVKLGEYTEYWDCVGNNDIVGDQFRYYYSELTGDEYAYFRVYTEKADYCTFYFIHGTYASDSTTRNSMSLNRDYTETYYNNGDYGIYYKFTATNTGSYKVILKSENGSANSRIIYKDSTGVPTKPGYSSEFICESNRVAESVISVIKGVTYYFYVEPIKMSVESRLPMKVTFQVSNIPVTSIELNSHALTMYTREQFQLEPTILPDNAAYKGIRYSSSDPNVAIVSEEGTITAVGYGTATIMVDADDGSNVQTSCDVTVLPRLVTSLTLNTNYIEGMCYKHEEVGHRLYATVYPLDADNRTVTYTSSNPEVVSVKESTGYLTLNKPGIAVITCTANDGSGVKTSCQVRVLPKLVTELELYEDSIEEDIATCEKDDCCLSANVYPEDADDTTVTFTSSNPDIVSVEPSTGQLTLNRPGTATITCSTNDGSNLSKTCKVVLKQSHFSGEKTVVGNIIYKVTSDTTGGGTVAVSGVSNKNAKSFVICNSLEIDGYSYDVIAVNNKAFANCKKLTDIVVGKNIQSIGKEVFYNCKKLKSIKIQSKKIKTVGKNAFKNISSKANIKVPSSRLSKYKKLFKGKGQKSSVKIKKI